MRTLLLVTTVLLAGFISGCSSMISEKEALKMAHDYIEYQIEYTSYSGDTKTWHKGEYIDWSQYECTAQCYDGDDDPDANCWVFKFNLNNPSWERGSSLEYFAVVVCQSGRIYKSLSL